MEDPTNTAEKLFSRTVAAIIGLDPEIPEPLGGINLEKPSGTSVRERDDGGAVFQPEDAFPSPLHSTVIDIFRHCAAGGAVPEIHADNTDSLVRLLWEGASRGKEIFTSFYAHKDNAKRALSALAVLDDPSRTPEEKARVVAGIWAPEIEMEDEEILRRWRLSDAEANPEPIRPTEVVIQLNGLYTLPENSVPAAGTTAGAGETAPSSEGTVEAHGPAAGSGGLAAGSGIPEEYRSRARALLEDPGRKIADYDHPVPLYERDENHELLGCLEELEEEIAFEKERGILPGEYRLPVLLSVSVTHENLDGPCGEWIHERVRDLDLHNLLIFVLTEETVSRIKGELLGADIGVYSVFGRYGVHFNALKYTQLLLERGYGIRAGFKLDTDEGIRSRDLYSVTGKTWFETLCHGLWGGTAVDWRDRRVTLAFNLGEYVNEKDIHRLGWEKAMREPDVKPPSSHLHEDIFFDKGYAHAKATALYNRFTRLEDYISHTVVKGGGYGITNEGLRRHLPFTFSLVGRAEDQQFYFSGLASGARGIFHPDLRIAHYKGKVEGSEKKTEITRFLGDMYRLIIFEHLAETAGVKEEIDPMPGVFAGPLARAQAYFHLLYRAIHYFNTGRTGDAEELLTGWEDLHRLAEDIDSGKISDMYAREREEWRHFVRAADAVGWDEARRVFEGLL